MAGSKTKPLFGGHVVNDSSASLGISRKQQRDLAAKNALFRVLGCQNEDFTQYNDRELEKRINALIEADYLKRKSRDVVQGQGICTVHLGGKKYKIKPLTMKEDEEFINKLGEFLDSFFAFAQEREIKLAHIGDDEQIDFSKSFTAIREFVFKSALNDFIDLFFVYAKDLKRDEIESTASRVEVIKAASDVAQSIYPLLREVFMTWMPDKMKALN